jgi:hypothetical protein
VAPELCEVSGVVEEPSWGEGEGVSSMTDKLSADKSSSSADSLIADESIFVVWGVSVVCVLYLCFKASGMPQGPT